ncbi:diaminopimelate decarboxylase [Chrysiogenes arsenatis]|uniref:diaminopimelate decarboxylase n=1 Tax=Chrysiogenes arsenatis TaxID=309797 RepID=UPI000401D6D7|nr:diaminopimelate decarboxylase [Chrysiogenes arsenatis]
MHYFSYQHGELHCEGVPLSRIADEVGTPVYVYSRQTLVRHCRVFREAFAGIPHTICFAVKANSNLSVLRTIAGEGIGADIVSGGELFRALKAGIDPAMIVYAGVGKQSHEIARALEIGIKMFNVESRGEMDVIQQVAKSLGKVAPIAIRVNPNVDAGTHPYISTGLRQNKFGIGIEGVMDDYQYAHGLSHVEVVGVHCHIGSQLTDIQPFVDALQIIRQLVLDLREQGIVLRYLDMGGGLGIRYNAETPPSPEELARAIRPIVADLGCELIFEPGRVLVGNAGIFLTRVIYTKSNYERKFIVVDGAMNDLARPSLYGSYHDILPADEAAGRQGTALADVVGPICETGDFFARERSVAPFAAGDLMALMSAGAYGFTMSSNYNSRPRVAEVMVDGDTYRVVRRRETFDDLVRLEEEV